ncbi:putative copper homeostasis protein [Calycina marina]|uniref:Copper homeostasis protein cutC homolog n=1 Tax=Calycina marina TaxID=1763456 RepID=A0A9P8CEQ4_9HELO|nr:putative copper homeostasis protein [Calycina marina]
MEGELREDDPPEKTKALPDTTKVEIACFTPISALRATASGADRVEFCAGNDVGGVTPYFEVVQPSLAEAGIPINVMIRPRGGDFVYTEDELLEMEASIGALPLASGFVFGILTSSLTVDEAACKRLLSLAGGRPCTFHRAFDMIPPSQMAIQLAILASLGFASVLTSGGAPTAEAGSEILVLLVDLADNTIDIIAGGGVRSANAAAIRTTGVKWLHSSAIVDGGDDADLEEVKMLLFRACESQSQSQIVR